MDSLDDSKVSSKGGFFKHVFNFDDDSKNEMLNIIQYALLAFIPIIFLNKAMQKFVPEADEQKSSLELLAESVIQIVVMFIGIFYINRVITYVPTYSGSKYPEISVIYIILSVLVITMSLQTKLGEKVSILFDRLVDLWEGRTDDNKNKKKSKGSVKVSQPISGQPQMQMTTEAMSNSLYGGMSQGTTSISQLPTEQVKQNAPDYNAMYRNDNTPLQGAATPGGGDFGGMIMAANEALGGSAFGSNF
jgi:hypothetical protein